APTVFGARAPSGVLDQNAPHGLCCGGKEMAAAVPVLGFLVINQAQVRFMHQRGRLKCLPWLLLGQSLSRELAQLVVDQRQELLGGVRAALLDVGQNVREVVHGGHPVAGTFRSGRAPSAQSGLGSFTEHRRDGEGSNRQEAAPWSVPRLPLSSTRRPNSE